MHAARPPAAFVPCPICGVRVDALRAPHAVAFEHGVRVACGSACAEALRRAVAPSLAEADAKESQAAYSQRDSEEALRLLMSSPGQLAAPVPQVPVPWMVFGLVFLNVVISAFAAHGWARPLATAGIGGTIALALRMHRRAITEAGWVPYLVGPGAAAVALLSAVLADGAASPAWAFVSAAGLLCLPALVDTARLPSLWLYAPNDKFWGPEVPRQWHAAHVASGGTAEFVQTAPVPNADGHDLIFVGRELWKPVIHLGGR